MAVIELEVPAEMADWYRSNGPSDRVNDGVDFSLWLEDRRRRREAGIRLGRIMDEMAHEARENGLTPEILEEILRDE